MLRISQRKHSLRAVCQNFRAHCAARLLSAYFVVLLVVVVRRWLALPTVRWARIARVFASEFLLTNARPWHMNPSPARFFSIVYIPTVSLGIFSKARALPQLNLQQRPSSRPLHIPVPLEHKVHSVTAPRYTRIGGQGEPDARIIVAPRLSLYPHASDSPLLTTLSRSWLALRQLRCTAEPATCMRRVASDR